MIITRSGRWCYSIELEHGLSQVGPGWNAYGHKHAQRKAARILARYQRRCAYRQESEVIA